VTSITGAGFLRSSNFKPLEVFVDDGVQVASTTFFMQNGPPTEMQLEAVNNSVTVQNLTAYSLKSIWRK